MARRRAANSKSKVPVTLNINVKVEELLKQVASSVSAQDQREQDRYAKAAARFAAGDTTVEDVFEVVRLLMNKHLVTGGVVCPCCTKAARIRKGPLTSAMARVLTMLDKHAEGHAHTQDGWTHVQEFLKSFATRLSNSATGGGDYAKLEDWGLIEHFVATRDDGSNRNGFWRITEKGRQFVRGKIKVPHQAWTYNSRLIRLDSSKLIDRDAAYRKLFNYEEI